MALQDKSLAGLLGDLSRETTTLIRDEVRIAKAEMEQKVDQAVGGALSIMMGGLIAFAGLLVLLWAATALLAELIEPWTLQPWVAPLIVGLIVAIVGLVMLSSGKRRLSFEGLTPKRTIRSLRRDREVLGG
jgi:xanthine/uracil permease